MSMTAKRGREAKSAAKSRDVLKGIADSLVQRVPDLAPHAAKGIAQALRDLLAGRDELSRSIRIDMQHYLINVAESHHSESAIPSETMLTTEAAAELMQCSRPYVAMLIDNKKLSGASVTDGGHRRVPESSVRAWIKEREAQAKRSDYREAAEQNGMYDIPETAFAPESTRRRS